MLVIDDDPDVRRAYARLLDRLGFSITEAADGLDGLARLSEEGFDAVLVDVSMPGFDGIDFLRVVRERNLSVPVVLMTGAVTFPKAESAIEYGAFRYLQKPITPERLSEVIWRAVHSHRVGEQYKARQDLHRMGGEERSSLEASFERSLDKLWMAFQPIMRWTDRNVFAYEALVRSDEPTLSNPGLLFDAAIRLGRLTELGRVIRRSIASEAASLPKDCLLFVNVHSAELNDEELFSPQAPLAALAQSVVFEVTERSTLDRVEGLFVRLKRLRALGYRIAIDDLGAGYAGLASFWRLEPDFVKLDLSMVSGIHLSSRKRSLVSGIAQIIARDLGVQVVCEGIECEGERDVLAADGLDLMQGYLFARPGRGFIQPKL